MKWLKIKFKLLLLLLTFSVSVKSVHGQGQGMTSNLNGNNYFPNPQNHGHNNYQETVQFPHSELASDHHVFSNAPILNSIMQRNVDIVQEPNPALHTQNSGQFAYQEKKSNPLKATPNALVNSNQNLNPQLHTHTTSYHRQVANDLQEQQYPQTQQQTQTNHPKRRRKLRRRYRIVQVPQEFLKQNPQIIEHIPTVQLEPHQLQQIEQMRQQENKQNQQTQFVQQQAPHFVAQESRQVLQTTIHHPQNIQQSQRAQNQWPAATNHQTHRHPRQFNRFFRRPPHNNRQHYQESRQIHQVQRHPRFFGLLPRYQYPRWGQNKNLHKLQHSQPNQFNHHQSFEQMQPAMSNNVARLGKTGRSSYSTLRSRATYADSGDNNNNEDYYSSGTPQEVHHHHDYYEEEEPIPADKRKKSKKKKKKAPEAKKEEEESFPKRIYTKTKNAIVSTTKAVFGAPKYIYTRYKSAYNKLGSATKKRTSQGHSKYVDKENSGWGQETEDYDDDTHLNTGWGWGDRRVTEDHHDGVEDDEYHKRRGKVGKGSGKTFGKRRNVKRNRGQQFNKSDRMLSMPSNPVNSWVNNNVIPQHQPQTQLPTVSG